MGLPTMAPAPPTDGPPVNVIRRAAPNVIAQSNSSMPAAIAEPTHLRITRQKIAEIIAEIFTAEIFAEMVSHRPGLSPSSTAAAPAAAASAAAAVDCRAVARAGGSPAPHQMLALQIVMRDAGRAQQVDHALSLPCQEAAGYSGASWIVGGDDALECERAANVVGRYE